MATWITHLRIAENILKAGFNLETIPFTVGNIGPDSGIPNGAFNNFDPPRKITHWFDDTNKISPKAFYDKYLSNTNVRQDKDYYSFLLGYYVHLLTDVEWLKLSDEKKKNTLHKEGFEKDPSFIWTIKKDWYGLDFIYLKNNPKSLFFTVFQNILEVPDYLDYFPENAFNIQVKYITDYYLGENEETKESFIYVTENEMDTFVITATQVMI